MRARGTSSARSGTRPRRASVTASSCTEPAASARPVAWPATSESRSSRRSTASAEPTCTGAKLAVVRRRLISSNSLVLEGRRRPYDRRHAGRRSPQAGRDRLPAARSARRAATGSAPSRSATTRAETARFLIDFGYVLQLLDLHAGASLVELGCGSGWMSRLAARQGVHVEGYDIAPQMIEIARAEAEREGVDVRFEVGDYEQLDLGRRFDACLLYDALHHSARGRPRLGERPARAEARRATAPRRAELEAPLPGPPGHRASTASTEFGYSRRGARSGCCARAGFTAHPPLPQQPQAPVFERAARGDGAPGRAVRLPRCSRRSGRRSGSRRERLSVRELGSVVSVFSGSSSTARA